MDVAGWHEDTIGRNDIGGPGYVKIFNAIGYYGFSKYLLVDVLYGPPHAIISLICVFS